MKWSVGCCNGKDNYLASHELVGWKPRVILDADTLVSIAIPSRIPGAVDR